MRVHALARTAALAAQVALASGVWQQNMCCRIGGAPLVAGDEARLAKFDIVLTNNMFYQNIHNDTWSAIREINPETKVFAYRDTLAADNEDTHAMPFSNNVARWNVSRGLEQGSLNLDNPNLFLLGNDDARIFVRSYPHTWLMDVGADKWRQYFIDATVADNFNRPWSTQGQYLDNCLSTLGNLHSSGFSEPPQKYLSSGTWEVAMTGFLTTLSDAFKAHSVPTLANRGATRTDDGVRAWLMLDQETAHASVGQLEEGAFAVRWCSCDVQFFPLEGWELQVGLMGQIQHSALMYQSHSKLLSTGPPGRDNFGVSVSFWDVLWYSLGSFHVGKNEDVQTSYFAFSEGDYNAIPWYDEYTLLDLGAAQGTFSNQTIGGATIYSREFEKGWVIVNPSNTANASAVPLAARGRLRTHENLHDDPSTLPTVTTISLQAHRAAFVLKA